MRQDQTLPQPSLRTGTRVQKVDVSALATRRNCSFYLLEGMGINSHVGAAGRCPGLADGRAVGVLQVGQQAVKAFLPVGGRVVHAPLSMVQGLTTQIP